MATTAYRGIGCSLKKGSTPIAGIKSIQGPEPKAEKVEITSLDSPGGYKEFISGDIDPGELKLECWYTASAWEGLVGDLQAGDSATYSLEIKPIGQETALATYSFSAVVIDCPLKIDPGSITFSATLAISGKISGGTIPA